jgi:hypothetical protein
LGDREPLLFPAGEPADGALRERRGANILQGLRDARVAFAVRKRQAEVRTVHAERDEIARAQRHIRIEFDALRHVTDRAARLARWRSEDAYVSAAGGQEADRNVQERRLAGAVAADDADEFAGRDLESQAGEDLPLAAREAYIGKRKRCLAHSARSSAPVSASIQICVVSPPGNVSETGTTFTCAAFAVASKRVVAGSIVWLL